jgi:hypothetical protein
VADAANSMAENSLSVFFTPLPFFLHPDHVLPSSTTSTISLLSFYGPLSVFPAPPCLSFSHPLACVFAPFWLSIYGPLPAFLDPLLSFMTLACLHSPLFACLLPLSRLSLYSPLPVFL